MWAPVLLLVAGFFPIGFSEYFDAFEGKQISSSELQEHDELNNTFWCVMEVNLPCIPEDYRRIDGSCNNLKEPLKGAGRNKFLRFLPGPGAYSKDYDLRKSVTGEELPLPRRLRTQLLAEGQTPDDMFTNNLANFLLIFSTSMADNHDTIGYSRLRRYCCLPEGAKDPICAPNEIPENDPVHRYSGHRCMPMTKPNTFQNKQCTSNDTEPSRLTTNTVALALSLVYGTDNKLLNEKGRLFKQGLLKYEIDDKGRVWPPSMRDALLVCRNLGNETRCFDTPTSTIINTIPGNMLNGLWFYRQHNRIAMQLHQQNPDWDDDRLFYEARDINIAIFQQILFYEVLPTLFGYDNVLKSGIISNSNGFRDLYNENVPPQQTIEFSAVLRWGHVIQQGTLIQYDKNGVPYDQIPVVDLTSRPGYLDQNNNIEGLTQGTFRQAGGKINHEIDPDMGERSIGPIVDLLDVATNDMAKGRYFGLQPYVQYLGYCRQKSYRCFDDLKEVINPGRIEMLQRIYRSVEDIDLMAGIWSERLMKGGYAPPTLYCIVEDQLVRSLVSDRFWFERPNRPHAFSAEQLAEIRKATVARFLCDNGDSVTEIQPHALLMPNSENKICSCSNLPAINISAWKESGIKNKSRSVEERIIERSTQRSMIRHIAKRIASRVRPPGSNSKAPDGIFIYEK